MSDEPRNPGDPPFIDDGLSPWEWPPNHAPFSTPVPTRPFVARARLPRDSAYGDIVKVAFGVFIIIAIALSLWCSTP